MANPDKNPKPLIPTGFITEFGEAEIPEDGINDLGMVDPTYVPGFSDLRIERDRQVAEARHGQRPPGKIMSLPVNMRWSRRQKATGKPDETKLQQAKLKGYEPVTKADVGKEWLTAIPDGAEVLPDGTIQKGDTILMKCDAKKAAQNAYRKQQLTMERLGASIQKVQEEGVKLRAGQVVKMEGDTTKGAPTQLGSQIKLADR